MERPICYKSLQLGGFYTYPLFTPYGRDIKRFPRRCVLVGTTNEQEFLGDKTGNRAYHVIPIHCTIDLEKTKLLREVFWRCAIALYEAGIPHHLATEEMRELQREDVGQFEKRDPWFDRVEAHVTSKLKANPDDWFIPADFLVEKSANDKTPTKVLTEFEDAKNDKASQMRLAGILRQLGLTKEQRWGGDSNTKIWIKKR